MRKCKTKLTRVGKFQTFNFKQAINQAIAALCFLNLAYAVL